MLGIFCTVGLGAEPADLPCVASLAFSAGAVLGGESIAGKVVLTAPAPAEGLAIRLTSSDPSAQVEGRLKAEPGRNVAAFTISTIPVVAAKTAVVTVAAGVCSSSVSAGVTVEPAELASVSLAAAEAPGNVSLTGAVILNGPAPWGGAVVNLQSSDPVVSVPVSVTIPAGQISAAFPLETRQSLSRNGVAITATYAASARAALLQVLPGI